MEIHRIDSRSSTTPVASPINFSYLPLPPKAPKDEVTLSESPRQPDPACWEAPPQEPQPEKTSYREPPRILTSFASELLDRSPQDVAKAQAAAQKATEEAEIAAAKAKQAEEEAKKAADDAKKTEADALKAQAAEKKAQSEAKKAEADAAKAEAETAKLAAEAKKADQEDQASEEEAKKSQAEAAQASADAVKAQADADATAFKAQQAAAVKQSTDNAKNAEDDTAAAQKVWMQMLMDRQKNAQDMWNIIRDAQTDMFESIQEVYIRRVKSQQKLLEAWSKAFFGWQ